jgi:hypothetical protein
MSQASYHCSTPHRCHTSSPLTIRGALASSMRRSSSRRSSARLQRPATTQQAYSIHRNMNKNTPTAIIKTVISPSLAVNPPAPRLSLSGTSGSVSGGHGWPPTDAPAVHSSGLCSQPPTRHGRYTSTFALTVPILRTSHSPWGRAAKPAPDCHASTGHPFD